MSYSSNVGIHILQHLSTSQPNISNIHSSQLSTHFLPARLNAFNNIHPWRACMITLLLLYLLYQSVHCLHQVEHRYKLFFLNAFFIITYICFELYNKKKTDSIVSSNYVIKTSQEIAESNQYSIGE